LEKGRSKQRVIAAVGRLDQIPQVIERLLAGRHFSLAIERILFLTVLHRLFHSGSDRSCVLVWKEDYAIPAIKAVGVVLDGEGRPLCCELWPGNVTDVKTLIPIVDRRMVEETFRTVKTLLETRPIFHKCDETIRGHVFCSFPALLLRKELQDRLDAQGDKFEWAQLLGNLEALQHTAVESQGKRFLLRSDLANTTAAVFRAVGVAIPPSVQKTEE